MKQTQIEYAIKGSLSSSPGEIGIIACSIGVLQGKYFTDLVNNLDKLLIESPRKNILDGADEILQYYFINPTKFSNKLSKIVLRHIPRFTQFLNSNRVYDRREFYFVTNSNNQNFFPLYNAIPEPQQYSKVEDGKSSPIVFFEKENKRKFNSDLYYYLFKCFFEKSSCKINTTSLNQKVTNEVLEAIDRLPMIYQNYIQIGLNLEFDDKIASQYLHVYTTYTSGIILDQVSNAAKTDQVILKMVTLIKNNEFQFIDSFELQNNSDDSNKENLYQLFNYHYTYTFCQLFLKGEIENIDSYNFIFEQIKSLIKMFIERSELFVRVILLYKVLAKQKQSDEQTFNLFWNRYFSLNEYADKKLDPLLYNDLSFHVSDLWQKAKDFSEILSISNNIFLNTIANIVPRIRDKVKFDYLIKSEELYPKDFTPIISFYNQNKQELSARLSINDLISKFKIADKYKQLNEAAIKSLLSPDLINEVEPEIIAPILQHIGLKEFLSIFDESNYLLINNSEAKQFIHAELLKPELVTLLLNDKTNWIFLTLPANEKKNISDKFYTHIINQIESKSNKRQDFQTLLKAEKFILTEEQVNSFISQFFSKKLMAQTASEFIDEILSIANKKHLELNIASDFLTDYNMQLVPIVPVIYTNSNLFNKDNFKHFSKELLDKIWTINDYEITVKVNLSDTILKNEVDLSEDFYIFLMQNIGNYFQSLDFQSLHKTFLILIEIKSNDKDFWNAFSKSELPNHLKNKYLSEPFNRKIILELNEVYKKNFNSTFTDSYLPFYIYGIDGMLYDKHFKNKGFKAMKTASLINRTLGIIIYTVFLICIALLIWVSVVYMKVNSTNKQLRLQIQGLDSLKKEILKVKAKNDSLINYIKADSTFTAKPNSQRNK